MSNRFTGSKGRVYLGNEPGQQGADEFSIHMYARDDGVSIIERGDYKIKDLVRAVNELPGVTATYEPPKPKFVLPRGIGAVIKSPLFPYVRVGKNEWRNANASWGNSFTDAEMTESDTYEYTILSEGIEI